MQRRIKFLLAFALVLSNALLAYSQVDYKDRPVPKEGLIRASGDRGSTPKLIALIRAQGVDFHTTPEVEAELRNGGVKPQVIQAAKENYRLPGTNKRAAYLTVSSNIPSTGFTIDGVGSFVGDLSERPILPGIYKVTARRPGYSIETASVDLSTPGARRTLAFNLKPMSIAQLFLEAEGAFKVRDYRAVEENLLEILRREPVNAKANMLLGQLYYVTGNVDRAAEPMLKGIRGGEQAVFPVYRSRGNSWSGRSVSPGRLVVRASSVAFQSGDKDDFDVPYTKVATLISTIKEEVSMKVLIPKKKGKGEDDEKYNFFPAKSQLDQPNIALLGCNCAKESGFIVSLISELRITASR